MTPLFKKLNFKNQPEILVVNAPESFLPEMEEMSDFTVFITDHGKVDKTGFILAFVTSQAETDQLSPMMAGKLRDDGVLWFVYPKQSSRKYKCDFNRDNGWTVLKTPGFDGVRMVSVD